MHLAQLPSGDWRFIRSCHPYAFRSGEWAEIVGVVWHEFPYTRDRLPTRQAYQIRFTDGVEDLWAVDDPTAQYEFKDSDADASQPAS